MMNVCRAGLHAFAPTTTWLRELGAASPPFLVVLGLSLPNSRILCGIAGIGMTLPNIVIILPHLRQPMLDSIRAIENPPVHQQNAQEHKTSSSDGSSTSQPAGLQVESPPLASASPCNMEHQTSSLSCAVLVDSHFHSVAIALPSKVDVNSKASPHTVLLQATGDTDHSQLPAQVHCSPDAESPEKHLVPGNLLTRKGRSAIHIPLPVPDTAEVTFFDATGASLSICDLDLGAESPTCKKYIVPEENYAAEDDGLLSAKNIVQGGQFAAAGLPATLEYAKTNEDPIHVESPVTNANTLPTAMKDYPSPVDGGTTSHLSGSLVARVATFQSDQAGHSMVGEVDVLKKRRPESLIFIPQSVIRRYPSALTVSAERCCAHRALSSGRDHQFTLPSHALAHHSITLSSRATPQASYDGHWRAAFHSEARPSRQSVKGQTLVTEMVPALDFLTLTSLAEPPPVHELNVLQRYSADRCRPGVLARAALRSRRSAARHRSNGIYGSPASDSDSDFDSDSQCSSASSADEDMFPHMLGADLIAAIDANSESEIHLAAPGMTIHAQPVGHEDFLASEASMADVSMVMHVSTMSSAEDVSNGEVRVPAALRSLTYEDIQQWASGVVEKCVRQVRRGRGPVDPLSPSQASEVCAEKPLGPGISQCPLAGLHCKLGAAALALTPAQGTKELPVPPPPTGARKPFLGRDPRDIPEFVPRQRHGAAMTGRGEGPRRPSARSTMDVTRDAATEVIARLECQAGFNAWQWFAGVDEARRANRIRGFQGALRCA